MKSDARSHVCSLGRNGLLLFAAVPNRRPYFAASAGEAFSYLAASFWIKRCCYREVLFVYWLSADSLLRELRAAWRYLCEAAESPMPRIIFSISTPPVFPPKSCIIA